MNNQFLEYKENPMTSSRLLSVLLLVMVALCLHVNDVTGAKSKLGKDVAQAKRSDKVEDLCKEAEDLNQAARNTLDSLEKDAKGNAIKYFTQDTLTAEINRLVALPDNTSAIAAVEAKRAALPRIITARDVDDKMSAAKTRADSASNISVLEARVATLEGVVAYMKTLK